MSLPSFLRGIIDRFKKGGVDSNDCIQAEEAEEPKGRGRGFSRSQEHGRDPPPQRHERPWKEQQVATCNVAGSVVSSGVNNIRNNILLNLEVGPGERDINSLLGVAVCYDTGQMTPTGKWSQAGAGPPPATTKKGTSWHPALNRRRSTV